MYKSLLLCIAFLTPLAATAQDTDSTRFLEARISQLEHQIASSKVRFSGQFISGFGLRSAPLGATTDETAFRIDRWFFTAEANVSETVGLRVTTDVKPTATSNANKDVLTLAYAHVDWDVQPGLTLQAGMIPGGWVNQVNSLWGFRGVTKVLPDAENLLSMGVLGASARYRLPDGRGTMGVVVHNGQTRQPSEEDQVEFGAYALGRPLHNFPIVVGGHASHTRTADALNVDRWGALVGVKGSRGLLSFDYEARSEEGQISTGVGVMSNLVLGRLAPLGTVTLVGLADWYTPSHSADSVERLRTVLGLAVEVAPGFNLALDYQREQANEAVFARTDGGFSDTDGTLYLHIFLTY